MSVHGIKMKSAAAAVLLAALWLPLAPRILEAADPPQEKTIRARRLAEPPRIDGVLSEAVWTVEGASEFIQRDPVDGAPPSETTTVWVAFDETHIYVAARLADSDPSRISGILGRRDELVDSDWFFIALDSYFDRRSGYYFGVNPAGSICDGTLFNDEDKDETWDGVWESAARVDDGGWSVEIRIPAQQLRFKKRDEQVWGVNFRRIIKRKNEEVFFSWVPKEESGYVSRFAVLTGLDGLRPGRSTEVWPYVTARAGLSPAEEGNPFRTGSEASGNAGFDLKVGLRSDLTLDATVNPDFGQVEVDPAVINISDQETYYVEKRPFFIEGADIFRFGTQGASQTRSYGWALPAFFYSRRVGRAPQGAVRTAGFVDSPDWTPILAAAKMTGKVGRGFSLGAVAALTGSAEAEIDRAGARSTLEVEPPTGYGVLRGLKEFGEGRSGLGFIATSVFRDLEDSDLAGRLARNAVVFGVDGWRFLDKDKIWALTGWLGGSAVSGSREALTRLQKSSLHYFQRPDAAYVNIDEEATSLSGWAGRAVLNKQQGRFVFNASLGAMSPGFQANDLGYHTRGDLTNGHVQTGFQSFHPGRIFRRWIGTLTYYRTHDFGGERIGEYWYLDGEAQFLNYWKAVLHLDYEPPKYSHYLTRGGPMALYPSGQTLRGSLSSDDRKTLVGGVRGHYRTHPDGGYNWSWGVSLLWKPGPNLRLSVNPSYQFRYAQGQWIMAVPDPLMTATLGTRYVLSDVDQRTFPVETRVSWTFTPKLSLQVYLQPYIGTGTFSKFKELAAVRTFDFNFYGENGSTIAYDGRTYFVDPDGDGPAGPFSFPDPEFSLKSLRGTVVLRWEYRPGSMLYLVWTQRREDHSRPGVFDPGRDFQDLLSAPGDNIFQVKFTYRFEL
ncbi:MAG: DUF5916 domain-containing protein [Acidobacteriota bacterium]|nr:DUF5916 domain-containing protein [Acidobacteriota bacterium]